MFIAALFIIVKTCKQSRYPSVDEWINKLVDGTLFSTKEK